MAVQHKTSRATVWHGLSPQNWVCLFMKEDPVGDQVFQYHHVAMHLGADGGNAANCLVKVQESATGAAGSWVDRYKFPRPLVPGGEIDFSTFHVRRWVRVLVYSTGAGRVDGTVNIPEEQVLPQLLPDVGDALLAANCSTLCELDCETGTETVA
jgi:hypothetical protein